MIYNTSRIKSDNGIKFYEQDIIFDDYIYAGNTDIEIELDYATPGFGVALINSRGKHLVTKDELLLFKIGHKHLQIIYKDDENTTVLSTIIASQAKCFTSKLKYKISKRKNIYTIYINETKITSYTANCDIESFNLGYYSNKDNVIKNIAIDSSIPYDWIVNMSNTNGGYVTFLADGFALEECIKPAEIEQIDIELSTGKYYLKYLKSDDCNINPYVMISNNKKIKDNEKNILNYDNSFYIPHDSKVSLKFVGTKGSIKNIAITKDKKNQYIQTTPELGDYKEISGSFIKFDLSNIMKIRFTGNVIFANGQDYSPFTYFVISDGETNYGIGDLSLALNVEYEYVYEKNELSIYRQGDILHKKIAINSNSLTIFFNVNGIIKNLVTTDLSGKETNFIAQPTLSRSVYGLVKSPIVVLKDDEPLNISASYRVIKSSHGDTKYLFTNVEREYFKANNLLKLNSLPLNKSGSVKVYGIPKDANFELSKLLYIENEFNDSIKECCKYYSVMHEEDIKKLGYIDKSTGKIKISNVNDFEYIVVDYIKADSYCINYDYEHSSYVVNISTEDEENITMLYDDTETVIDNFEFVSKKTYINTNIKPTKDCYVVLGR